MKRFTKVVSVLLAVMMVLCTISALSFSASAAETSKINITTNAGGAVSYDYSKSSKQVTVTYTLQSDLYIRNIQAVATYDTSVLSLASTTTKKTISPVFYGTSGAGFIANLDLDGKIKFNATDLNGYDFTKKATVFTAVFDVKENATIKNTAIDLDIFILTAQESEDSESNDVKLIYLDKVVNNNFKVNASAVVTGEETEPSEVVVKFAAPTSKFAARYRWLKPVFYYNTTQDFTTAKKIEMKATEDKYYTADVGSNKFIDGQGWTIFELDLTKAQMSEIEAAKYTGFATADGVNRTTLTASSSVLKAGVDTYTMKYGTTVNKLSALNGKTFVIRDSEWGAESALSYVGYWVSDYVTIKAAAPIAITPYFNWDAMSLYYGDTTVYTDMSKIAMINTGEATKVSDIVEVADIPADKTIKNGRWYIFAITLDTNATKTVEAAKYAGFCKTGAENRTSIVMNVLKAKTNSCNGVYNTTARKFKDVENQIFIMKGSTKNPSVATYYGEWVTKDIYSQGKDDTVTIYFAAPKSTNATKNWNGVELYYGTTPTYTETERIEMVKTGKTLAVKASTLTSPSLEAGNWDIYSATLTVEQMKAIDTSASVGFVKKGSFNRTALFTYRNICKASKLDGITKYNGVAESIESFDGYTFLINGHYPTADEYISYTGSWVVA